MRFLLDTNVVIALGKGNGRIIERIRHHGLSGCVVSTVVLHELYFGAFKSGRVAENLRAADGIPFEALDFTREDARTAGEIRHTLRRLGTPIGPYDTLIAGQALARGLTLVTRNTREFGRVEGLRVEDWEV